MDWFLIAVFEGVILAVLFVPDLLEWLRLRSWLRRRRISWEEWKQSAKNDE